MDPWEEREKQYYLIMMRDLKQIFGPGPVLTTESSEGYDKMLLRTLEALRPKDFMERILIKHLADFTWEIIRYSRHKAEHMQRKFRQLAATAENKKARPQAFAEASHAAEPSSSQNGMHGAIGEVEDVTAAAPTYADHAEALEHGIDFAERLDGLLKAAVARRNDVIDQLERHREGLGGQTHQSIEYIRSMMAAEFRRAGFKDPWPHPSLQEELNQMSINSILGKEPAPSPEDQAVMAELYQASEAEMERLAAMEKSNRGESTSDSSAGDKNDTR